MGVIHLYVDTKDAMGANIINQVCEGLKNYIEEITSEKVTMCIVSNLSDTKCIEATVTLEKNRSCFRLQDRRGFLFCTDGSLQSSHK